MGFLEAELGGDGTVADPSLSLESDLESQEAKTGRASGAGAAARQARQNRESILDREEAIAQRMDAAWQQAVAAIDEALQEEVGGRAGLPLVQRLGTPEVSIVIPVYNEANTIGEIITRTMGLPLNLEVIVVNDASRDGTGELLDWFAGTPGLHVIHLLRNQGKGAAVRTGIYKATGRFVVIQDADLEYPPEQIPQLLEPLREERADVVYGSRFLKGAGNTSWWHALGNSALTWVSNATTGLKLTDMETGHKAFHREWLSEVPIAQDRFGIEPELTAKLARRGARFVEVPITYAPRSYAEGKKIGFKDLLQGLWCIVRYGVRD